MIDKSQEVLLRYIHETDIILNELLSTSLFSGSAKIIPAIDLGFPHDVIRLAGGLATGICLTWTSQIPFIPVDVCMNACTVSIYEIDPLPSVTPQDVEELLNCLNRSSYKANFHRGNHFISVVKSKRTLALYLIIHSSAAEFEVDYNGLYPVEGNWVYNHTKTFYSHNRYIRYLDGKDAHLFWKLASNLYSFNENRHDFIVSTLLSRKSNILNSAHYHHYGMPNSNTALLGCQIVSPGDVVPLLTRPGEDIHMIRYNKVLDNSCALDRRGQESSRFVVPHGLGKKHNGIPVFSVERSIFHFDSIDYEIKYGTSLRNHPGLELRDVPITTFLAGTYDYTSEDEFTQLYSFNKDGFKMWQSQQ